MKPAKVTIAGEGLKVGDAISHPAGKLLSGGYDAERNELFLSSVMGHPRGVAAAGGNPSIESIAGLRVLIVDTGAVYWATDSMSLPRALDENQSNAVQIGLEDHFHGQPVVRVEKLDEIPK